MTNMDATAPGVLIVGSGHGLRVHLPALRAAAGWVPPVPTTSI